MQFKTLDQIKHINQFYIGNYDISDNNQYILAILSRSLIIFSCSNTRLESSGSTNPLREQVALINPEDKYGLVKRAIFPSSLVTTNHYTCASFSPSFSSSETYFIAAATTDHSLYIYKPPSTFNQAWKEVMNVTEFLCSIFKDGLFKDETCFVYDSPDWNFDRRNTGTKHTKIDFDFSQPKVSQRDHFILTFLCVSWSPMMQDKIGRFSLLTLGTKAALIVLRASINENNELELTLVELADLNQQLEYPGNTFISTLNWRIVDHVPTLTSGHSNGGVAEWRFEMDKIQLYQERVKPNNSTITDLQRSPPDQNGDSMLVMLKGISFKLCKGDNVSPNITFPNTLNSLSSVSFLTHDSFIVCGLDGQIHKVIVPEAYWNTMDRGLLQIENIQFPTTINNGELIPSQNFYSVFPSPNNLIYFTFENLMGSTTSMFKRRKNNSLIRIHSLDNFDFYKNTLIQKYKQIDSLKETNNLWDLRYYQKSLREPQLLNILDIITKELESNLISPKEYLNLSRLYITTYNSLKKQNSKQLSVQKLDQFKATIDYEYILKVLKVVKSNYTNHKFTPEQKTSALLMCDWLLSHPNLENSTIELIHSVYKILKEGIPSDIKNLPIRESCIFCKSEIPNNVYSKDEIVCPNGCPLIRCPRSKMLAENTIKCSACDIDYTILAQEMTSETDSQAVYPSIPFIFDIVKSSSCIYCGTSLCKHYPFEE